MGTDAVLTAELLATVSPMQLLAAGLFVVGLIGVTLLVIHLFGAKSGDDKSEELDMSSAAPYKVPSPEEREEVIDVEAIPVDDVEESVEDSGSGDEYTDDRVSVDSGEEAIASDLVYDSELDPDLDERSL